MTTNTETSNGLVERVARAIFAASFSANEDPAIIQGCWDRWTEDRERALRQARAAIEASGADRLEHLERALTEAREDIDFACTAIMKCFEHKARARLEQRLRQIDAALNQSGNK